MEPTRTIWQDLGVKPGDVPDLSFMLFDHTPSNKAAYQYFVQSNKLKSKGTIQTLMDMHALMSKSLRIVSPKLVFTPDFPDYLLSEDDPKYLETYPVIVYNDDLSMPHHRNDIFQRNYNEYKTIPNIPAPHITWGVVRSEPGTFGGDPFRGTQEVKPRPREFLAIFNPNLKKHVSGLVKDTFVKQYGHLTKYLKIYGQAFDNLVQYNIWARSAWEAEELTEWFKDYMRVYTGMFREAGIVQMWFDRRVRDDTLVQIKNKFHLRSFLYYIRTERIDINSVLPIRRIETKIHVESLPQGIGVGSDEIVVDDFHDKLLNKWHSENQLLV